MTAATTDRAEFDALLKGHRVVPVVREVFSDIETPVGVYRRLAGGRPGTFLLESVEHGVGSRWSFVGVRAAATLTSDEGAHYDKVITLRAEDIAPVVTWGTSPEDVLPITARVPAASDFQGGKVEAA